MPTNYRLFIAIDLPADVQSALASVQHTLSPLNAVRWTKFTQIHLTLQFLGDTPAELVPKLSVALAETVPAVPQFSLSLAKIGAFPNLKRPRIIWAGIDPNATLTELHRAVSAATASAGFAPDKKPFSPHLTIGRVKNHARSADYRAIAATIARENINKIATMRVRDVHLIRSQLTRQGPIYTHLHTVQLN